MTDNFITRQGIAKLRGELDALKKKRPEVAEHLKESAALGDISENAEYLEAKENQAFLEGRILEIENILRTSLLVQPEYRKAFGAIGVGCAVELLSSGKKQRFTIVGIGEGNPKKFEISSDSPIAQAILGRSVGDVVRISTPSGKRIYKISRIE
jgi:transcription elongation factor GreA